jgi:pyridoxine/pyridoxamine 5'-phosphate oxidase
MCYITRWDNSLGLPRSDSPRACLHKPWRSCRNQRRLVGRVETICIDHVTSVTYYKYCRYCELCGS